MLNCMDTESELKIALSVNGKQQLHRKGACTSCEVVLTFLERLAYCSCLNFLRSGLLLLTAPVKCTRSQAFANTSL